DGATTRACVDGVGPLARLAATGSAGASPSERRPRAGGPTAAVTGLGLLPRCAVAATARATVATAVSRSSAAAGLDVEAIGNEPVRALDGRQIASATAVT